MAPRIYKSSYPDIPVYNRSLFSHILPLTGENFVGGFPSSHPAFVDAPTATTLTRLQLRNLALALAHGLRHNPSNPTKRGDTVLIYSPNSLAWPVALFGAIASGLKCTLANSAYTHKELEFQYVDSGAQLVLTSEEGLPNVFAMFKDLGVSTEEAQKRIIALNTGLEWAGGPIAPLSKEAEGLATLQSLLNLGSFKEEEKFDGELANETVLLCYSSGTSGKPKGVETTHRNITSCLDQVTNVLFKFEPGKDALIGILPFYHIYGVVTLLALPLNVGTSVVIMPRFHPEHFCAYIEKYRISVAFVAPPVLVLLKVYPGVDRHDLSSLTRYVSGAAPLGGALAEAVKGRLEKKSGKPVYITQGYGTTETSPITHVLPLEYIEKKAGSVGNLLPNLEARLVVDNHNDAEEGQPGELWIRGPLVMKGYLNNPEATKDCITEDGWLKTGDVAIRDPDGFYSIVDRKKEMIKYKGFQVAPAEMESLLLTHPDIADAAVIGVESESLATELPRAYIAPAKPASLPTDEARAAFALEVQEWVKLNAANHKQLRGGVVIVNAIPKSTAGKILRRELRERAKLELESKDPAEQLRLTGSMA